ncbi:kelch repeat-containing protein [uncultured Psychroserpens sp.]|uniref:Kelch repeat-containing protein n=1 Tax=uncultured Psychroserpens sp. TaxID=255436 RepID=UPI00262080D0|nr:kelch repeat-containing protein [uncultured Psychroserpens sp.]
MNTKLIALIIILSTFLFTTEKTLKDTPCPRNQPVIAYHKTDNIIYLFGGYCSTHKKRLNDLWAYDGKNWNQIETPTSPEPRSGHTMVYNSENQSLILFGGKNDNQELLNDTWEWKNKKWTQLKIKGPPKRQSHSMTYHSTDHGIYIFGGSNIEKASLNDTWVLKHNMWTQLNFITDPPPRLQHKTAYDASQNKIVLFGGFNRTENEKHVYGDTWELDKTGWTLKSNTKELARDHHALVYNHTIEKVILFGGYNNGYYGDTQIWNGRNWTLDSTNETLARAGKPGLIYHDALKKIILFGGWNSTNKPLTDFWVYNIENKNWETY